MYEITDLSPVMDVLNPTKEDFDLLNREAVENTNCKGC